VGLVLLVTLLAIPLSGLTAAAPKMAEPQRAQELVRQAGEAYARYDFAQNERAIELYRRAARLDPRSSRAHAGLANALVQRALRWPYGGAQSARSFNRLKDALAASQQDNPRTAALLARAMRMAKKAVELAPSDAAARKSLAFAHSARREFSPALEEYRVAVGLDPDAWGAMINMGEILEIEGRAAEAVAMFEQAYDAMARTRVAPDAEASPRRPELGIHIGDAYRARGALQESALWYRRVLDAEPLHPAATVRLAAVLQQTGDAKAARALCEALRSRLGDAAGCRI
jgi:tetratricopeptide (TPR) repeat protein